MKAREQERKEIEALHRWEEAHIFEGGGNILHNPARSCFQLWPIIGAKETKFGKINGESMVETNYWALHFIRKDLEVSAVLYIVHVNLCWPSLVKT